MRADEGDEGNGLTGETEERRRTEFLEPRRTRRARRDAAVRLGRRRRPAAMYENANTNRSGAVGGLYLRPRTSRLSACVARRPIERPPPFAFVPPFLL